MTFKNLFLNKAIFILSILMSVISCSDTDCCDYLSTEKISEGIYLEKYIVYCGGVLGVSVVESYLTDSVSFRIKVGKEFDHNSFTVIEINGSYYGLLSEFQRKKVILSKTSYKLSDLTFSKFASEYSSFQPLVGELLFDCNNHSGFRDLNYGNNNSNYKVKRTQFQCDNNGEKIYINAFYLINAKNQWLLMYNYDMKNWSKGKTHFNYQINKKNLLITEYELIPNVDTVEYKLIDLDKLKEESNSRLTPICE